jgi:hypothetical protein
LTNFHQYSFNIQKKNEDENEMKMKKKMMNLLGEGDMDNKTTNQSYSVSRKICQITGPSLRFDILLVL